MGCDMTLVVEYRESKEAPWKVASQKYTRRGFYVLGPDELEYELSHPGGSWQEEVYTIPYVDRNYYLQSRLGMSTYKTHWKSTYGCAKEPAGLPSDLSKQLKKRIKKVNRYNREYREKCLLRGEQPSDIYVDFTWFSLKELMEEYARHMHESRLASLKKEPFVGEPGTGYRYFQSIDPYVPKREDYIDLRYLIERMWGLEKDVENVRAVIWFSC